MTKETIFAYTAPGSNYPAYVNISREGGQVTIIARGPADGYNCGHTVQVRVPLEAFNETNLLSKP